uniref:Uncharacterized protein n=1 Tax=Anopheles dirus TaxID=7168 RepID=A0A182N097_9DIPT
VERRFGSVRSLTHANEPPISSINSSTVVNSAVDATNYHQHPRGEQKKIVRPHRPPPPPPTTPPTPSSVAGGTRSPLEQQPPPLPTTKPPAAAGTHHRKSVSFDLHEDTHGFDTALHHARAAFAGPPTPTAAAPDLKGILRAGSPSSTSTNRSSSSPPEQRAGPRVANEDSDPDTDSSTDSSTDTDAEEEEEGLPAAPGIPPIRQAEVVRNQAARKLREEFGQGDLVEYEHDTVTNTIREVRTERVQMLPAKYDTLPVKRTAQFVHENTPNNLLVTDDVHRQVLLEENEVRNKLLAQYAHDHQHHQQHQQLYGASITSTTNVHHQHHHQHTSGDLVGRVPSPYFYESGSASVSPLPPPAHYLPGVYDPHHPHHYHQQHLGKHLGPASSPDQLGLQLPQIYPPVQILPVHYAKLPTPQHTIYTYASGSVPVSHPPIMSATSSTPLPYAPVPPYHIVSHPSTMYGGGGGVPGTTYVSSTHPTGVAAQHAAMPSPPLGPKTPKSVSDKKRFFENAMEDQQKPTPKSDKVFSFLSQDEVEKLRQEEERKIATLGKDRVHQRYGDDDEDDRSDGGEGDQPVAATPGDKSDINDNNMREEPKQAAGSPLAKTPISRIPIRTANAEKRARASNCLPPEYDESKLSPSEIRALRAQKRAAWRQARLKSIENDALQAQIMIQAMNANAVQEDAQLNASGASDGVDGTPGAEELAVDAPSAPQSQSPMAASNGEQQPGCGSDDDRDRRQHSSSADEEEEDGGDRLARRFPRLAVKSRPGSEVVVRETETVVEEKVTRRTEEAPGGGLRTVEYIEKVIETEVETMREKIIVFELEDSSSGDSEEQQRPDVNNGVTEPDGHHWPETAADGNDLMEEDEEDEEEEEEHLHQQQQQQQQQRQPEPEPVQLQTIVEVINPMLTGDGHPNDIAIGRYNDVVYGEDEDSLAAATTPHEYARFSAAYEHGTYESINDKMKHVLRELKQNEKVRQNLSKSLTEDEIMALQAQEEEDDEPEPGQAEEEEEEEEEDASERYEEKTGAIGTVFMVRERLINDFYTHQSELAQEQQQQHHQHQRKYQQQLLDDVASYRDCEVITNPNAERFSPPAYDNHSGPSQLYHQTLHSEKLKAVFGSDDEDDDEDEDADQRNGNTAVRTHRDAPDDDEEEEEEEEKVAPSAATTVASSNAPASSSSAGTGPLPAAGNSKRKKRKGKKKK